MIRRWESALGGLCLAVAGLVALAIVFGGSATYASIAGDFAPATFQFAPGDAAQRSVRVDLPVLLRYHDAWFAYVTGDAADPPVSFGAPVFTTAEYAHMRDVRRVFVGARVAAVAAVAIAGLLVVRVSRRGGRAAALLARNAALVAGAGVLVVAVAAAVAFEPLFLLFHEIVFPQGNFLFEASSNLLALYPDQYWYGVTLRIGASFVLAGLLSGVVAHATLGSRRR